MSTLGFSDGLFFGVSFLGGLDVFLVADVLAIGVNCLHHEHELAKVVVVALECEYIQCVLSVSLETDSMLRQILLDLRTEIVSVDLSWELAPTDGGSRAHSTQLLVSIN